MSNSTVISLFTQNTSIPEPLIGLIADLTAHLDDHWHLHKEGKGHWRTLLSVLPFLLVIIYYIILLLY